VLRSLRLQNFKAFDDFTITFSGDAFLVGPNNTGKSTVIAALRAVANMISVASRLRATSFLEIDGFEQAGHDFTGPQLGLNEDNLRHEFREVETRLTAEFDRDGRIVAVWPPGEYGGFFYTLDSDVNLHEPRDVKKVFPTVGLVPVLSPIDQNEKPLSEKHVRSNTDGLLSSRHFRNQLFLLEQAAGGRADNGFEEFKNFAGPWIPELDLRELKLAYGEGDAHFELLYLEPGSSSAKEIFWTGDGVQIWLELLLHLFRLQGTEVIVLDEPDVFLHSDLQRRLVLFLEEQEAQTITATHSAEVITEAPRSSVTWIDKTRKRALRSPKSDILFDLATALGTPFNLRLARALKTHVVLFVEGKDMKLLRDLARRLELTNIVREDGVAVVPLGGFDRWEHVEPFKWLISEFLEDAVEAHVVLDRDYRSEATVEKVRRRLRDIGVKPHIWRRKELENYLLDIGALARASGASEPWIEATLGDCAAELEDDVHSQIQAEHQRVLRKTGKSDATINKLAKKEADKLWADPARRVHACGGKDLIRHLNKKLAAGGYEPVSDRKLAKTLRKTEIPKELRDVLKAVNQAAA
jgi:hypothetical protein